ncbi:MAG: aryl-sulfate sulfotransferase [Methanomassiliicoccaceae archaeon]|jgi:hypothetical protein|nr:aryl-sulfate sulfotransferase [Methanomassiliicoccaceae archaeon]
MIVHDALDNEDEEEYFTIITVTYDSNNDKRLTSDSDIRVGKDQLDPDKFTWLGYAFDCWNTQADGSGTNIYAVDDIDPDLFEGEAIVLYAIWKEVDTSASLAGGVLDFTALDAAVEYEITVNGNGTFAGTTVNNTFDLSAVTSLSGAAVWSDPDTDVQYEIVITAFDSDGESLEVASFTITVIGDRDHTKLGYAFCWNTQADGGGTGVCTFSDIDLNSDTDDSITLYAVWSEENILSRLTGGILHFTALQFAAEYEITVSGSGTFAVTTQSNTFDLSAVASLNNATTWTRPDSGNIRYKIVVTAFDTDGESLEVANFNHDSEIGVTEISSTLHRWKLGITARFNEIYDTDNQKAVRNEINDLIANYKYTPQNPLVIKNPFGTNELGLYVYFETPESSKMSYTVKTARDGSAVKNFTRAVNEGAYGTVHEFQVMGLVHQGLCEIIFDIKAQSAQTSSVAALKVNGQCSTNPPDLSIEYIDNDNADKITDGMFVVFDSPRPNIHIFDNDGIRRGYITCGYGYTRILIDDKGNWIYDGTREKVVVTNNLGEVIKIYPTPGYVNHHDIIFGENNDILKLVTGNGQTEDVIMFIDRDTGEHTFLNLRDFFPDYDFARNGGDWFHANSITIVPEDNGIYSLLISSRELSAIIKIKDLYGTPSLDWIITDNINMEPYGTILEKIDGIPNLGQHTITYIKHDENDPTKYYVHLFNNLFKFSTSNNSYTDNDYDFGDMDESLIGSKSSMDIYMIDEATGTCTLVQTVDVAFSIFMSSSQIYIGNYVIGSSYGPYIYEYDDEGNLLVQYKFGGNLQSPQFYRVLKYNI